MEKKWVSRTGVGYLLLMMMLWAVAVSPALACPSDGSQCRNCIVDRMKNGCPPCVPILRCMARCLWAGTSQPKCIKKCDCNDGYPRLSDCKKCMWHCKCSCTSS